MKKIIAFGISVALILGAATAAYAATETAQTAGNANYTDLKHTNRAYEAVNAMNGKGIRAILMAALSQKTHFQEQSLQRLYIGW